MMRAWYPSSRKRFLAATICALGLLVFQPLPVRAGIDTSTYDQRVVGSGGASPGESLAKGDVNNDGYTDLLVNAEYYSGDKGAAYLYLGSASGISTTPDLTFIGSNTSGAYLTGDNPGLAMGDLNNDGYDDVIITSYYTSEIFVYLGGPSMDATADFTTTVSYSPYSLWAGSDWNHDGYNDLVVGDGVTKTYIYNGSSSFDFTADVTFTGASGSAFGELVTSAGDVNHDGYEDLLSSVPGDDTVATNAGAVNVYLGSASGITTTAAATVYGAAANDNFGYNARGVGDVNNDGYDDIIVGAINNDTNGSNAGSAYIYYGSASFDTTADVTLRGAAAGDYFGAPLTGIGDVNGDGYDDVAVTAEGYSSFAGRVYIYYGGASMDAVADRTLDAENTGDYFGAYYQDGIIIADVNGDGGADLIIGAPGYPAGSGDGALYIYFGDPVGGSGDSGSSASSSSSSDSSSYSLSLSVSPGTLNHTTNQRTITGSSTKRIKLSVKAPDPDQLQTVTLRVNGKTYPLKRTQTPGLYTLMLPKLSPGKHSYVLSANYSSATIRDSGFITVPTPLKATTHTNPLIPLINQLFMQAYNRAPTMNEWHYWAARILNHDKHTAAELLGAMEWGRNHISEVLH